MNEDTTKNLNEKGSFEETVLARLDAIQTDLHGVKLVVNDMNKRLTMLEDKVEQRLFDTRPMWEGVQAQLTTIQEQLTTVQATTKQMDTKLGILNNAVLDVRADQMMLEKRVVRIENTEIGQG